MFLDLSKLPNPYELKSGGEKASYVFITEKGNKYIINFLDKTSDYPKSEIGSSIIYEFQFLRIVTKDTTIDDRIMSTILSSIEKTILEERNVVIYICDSSDRKQSIRSKLFDKWFNKYAMLGINKIDGTIQACDPDDHRECVSVIINQKNPDYKNVEALFNLMLNERDRGKNPMFNI